MPAALSSGRVGARQAKYGAYEAVLGKRPFVFDLKDDGMLFGALKFSDHPRARVLSIDTSAAQAVPGVVRVFTSVDVTGERRLGLILEDWPVMVATGEVTGYIGDVLAIVVAESEKIARQAAKRTRVRYEVLRPVTSVAEALEADAPRLHPEGNVLSETRLARGDALRAIADAAYVSRGVFTTQRIEHAFMETECAFARPWTNGSLPGVEVSRRARELTKTAGRSHGSLDSPRKGSA